MKRFYYANTITGFLQDDENLILGKLSAAHQYVLNDLTKNSWFSQIRLLKRQLEKIERGQIYFEYSIPRMGKRVDNILIIDDKIFVLEFKIGEKTYSKQAVDQVVDYCLDLRNFHEGSHKANLIPMLIATDALEINSEIVVGDQLFNPIKTNKDSLGKIILSILEITAINKIDPLMWQDSVYKPTPTIIEAAQALYRNHSVTEISRNDAGAKNLFITSNRISKIIDEAKATKKKTIIFLTGVPGAGKTLAGLNIANMRKNIAEDDHAVFLSGNGALVQVLQKSLIKDEVTAAKLNEGRITASESGRKVKKFIQNIHHFRDEYMPKLHKQPQIPFEKIAIFDEAQRAWQKEQVAGFMKRKKGIENFNMSEPEFLIEVMNRHRDWCAIVCLIGGGQEINTGEAGISEWILALKNHYPNWEIYISDKIFSDKEYLRDQDLKTWLMLNSNPEKDLHLATSVRSFRSEKVSELVYSILDIKPENTRMLLAEIQDNYPIYITRSLLKAKKWLRKKAVGTERIGIVASSGGRRLRALGIDVKNVIDPSNWFLNSAEDVRSSYFLEDVATEFDIQGLEIDYVCLAWDINMYMENDNWVYKNFSGTKWNNISDENNAAKMFLKNAYRVLMTRARQGLIIYLPEGDDLDKTRPGKLYDNNFEYFKMLGIPVI